MAPAGPMFAAMTGVGKRLLPFAVAALVGCVLSLSWQSIELFEAASRRARERELSREAQYSLAMLKGEAEAMRTRAEGLATLPGIRRLVGARASLPQETEALDATSADDMLCESIESHQLPGEDLDCWLLDDDWAIFAYSGSSPNRARQAIPADLLGDAALAPAGQSLTFWVVQDKATGASPHPQVSGTLAHLYAMVRVFDGEENAATLLVRKTVPATKTVAFAVGHHENASEVTFVDAEMAWRFTTSDGARLPSGEMVGRNDVGERYTNWLYDPAHGIGVAARSTANVRSSPWREVRSKILELTVVALLLGLAFPLTMRHYRKRLLQLAKRMDSIAESRTVAQKADFERSLFELEKQLRDARSSEARLQAAHRVLEENTEKFARLSHVDPLTDLANRRQFDEFLENEWRRGTRRNSSISLLLIDVDYFKVFVESYGHTAGDDCLREIARALASAGRRPGDLVARLGGEEFAIVLSDTDVEGARAVAHHVRSAVEALAIDHETTLVRGCEIVTLCIGIATEQVTNMSGPAVLLYHADEALYLAKQDGRNCVRTYEENAIRVESSTGIRIPTNRPFVTKGRGSKGGG